MNTSTTRADHHALFAACASALLLTACGGGGSSPPPPPPPPPPPASPTLPLTFEIQRNVRPAAGLSLSLAESTLLVARWAHETVEVQRSRTALSSTDACADGGTRELTLTDIDGDGRPSPGDRLRVRYANCRIDMLASLVTGTADIGLRQPAAGHDLGGEIRTQDANGWRLVPVDLLRAQIPEAYLRVAIGFDTSVRDDDTAALVTPVAGGQFAFAATVLGRPITERLAITRVAHRLDHIDARWEMSIDGRLNSESLVGQLDIATTRPLAGWLDAAPHEGRLVIAGAGASRLTVGPVTTNPNASIDVDRDGDGRPEASEALAWSEAFSGYPWWPRMRNTPALQRAAPDRPRGVIATPLRQVPDTSAPIALRPTMQFDFAAPVDIAQLPAFRLRRVPNDPPFLTQLPDLDWGPETIDMTASVRGARLILAATAQLQPGRRYRLETRAPGAASFDARGPVRSVLGTEFTPVLDPIRTRNSLSASAAFAPRALASAAASDLSLDGSGSFEDEGGLASFAWRQISGPPLLLPTPAAARTIARPAAPVTAPIRAEVELTVTNAAGEIDITRMPLDLVPVPSSPPPLLYFRSTPGSVVGGGEVRIRMPQEATQEAYVTVTPSLNVFIVENGPDPSTRGPSWSFSFVPGSGTQVVPGTYLDTTAFFGGNGWGETSSQADVTVLDIAWNSSNQVTRLAADFSVVGPSSRVYGSIRINSNLPVSRY